MIRLLLILFVSLSFNSQAQFEPSNGAPESKPTYYFLKNAEILIAPGKTMQLGSIVIKDNIIQEVGLLVFKPEGAIEIDCKGKTIVPGFIDLKSSIGLPELKSERKSSYGPQYESSKSDAYYWNEAVHPELHANESFQGGEKLFEKYHDAGFTFVLTHYEDGVIQGTGALIALDKTEEKNQIIVPHGSIHYSFDKGISQQVYPSSQMGSIALLRQALYDLEWYRNNSEKVNLSLNALKENYEKPSFFTVEEGVEILRAQKIAIEFKKNFNYYCSGDEYKYINSLDSIKGTFIVNLNFPGSFDVSNPYINRQIPLKSLKHWELAPSNPYFLVSRGKNVAITMDKLDSSADFWKNLKLAMKRGLSEEQALASLTTIPAKTIGLDQQIGTIEKGKIASFTLFDANPFEENATLLEVWNQGNRTIKNKAIDYDLLGKYNVLIEDVIYPIELTCDGGKPKATWEKSIVTTDPKTGKSSSKTEKVSVKVEMVNNDVNFQFSPNDDGIYNLHGKINTRFGAIEGNGTSPNGTWIIWSAVRKEKYKSEKDKKENDLDTNYSASIWLPNMSYGNDSLVSKRPLVIRNVTVWTNENAGIIKDASVIVKDGKITFVGTGGFSSPANALEIDGKGMHLTSGIIDEHSHIAISKGVNEGSQAITSEVSIGTVVRADDINVYRQLAGGVTCSQLLHGSANPIGGQSAIIKLKWGYTPEEMLVPNAPKFIKFALGENVKQSNWGSYATTRFPQTRMGVEQVYYDAFYRAKQYEQEWLSFKNKAGKQPRRDLELDALVEILNKERFITCHSYVQSEINMLMKMADSLGFKINTFTHILEGYKVADKMAEHGAGGSTFSDWWAYKYEVKDAIPYNAKMMADQGVVVAINSDDAEMGRRLNQEAAKAVKYGGMSEIEAWKMVTLNPAKLLHLDDRMGSVAVGKDADLVLWTASPLSIEAIVDKTIIDGVVLFDRMEDAKLQVQNQKEKARIIAKMADDKSGKKKKFTKEESKHYHCNTLGEEGTTEENTH